MASDVRDFNGWISRAEQATASGRKEDAVAFFERALALRPRDIRTLNAKGALLGSMGRFGEAIAAFEAAAMETPGSAELQYNIGFALQCQRHMHEAIARYERAISLRPNYPEALTNLALSFVSVGRYEDAVASAEAAVRLDPNNPQLINNLGHAQFKLQRFEAARQSFEVALRIASAFVDARSNLGRCLVHLGMAEDAILHFEAALTFVPGHAPSIEGLARCYRSLERYDDLVTELRRHAALAPRAVIAWTELGAALASLDRRREAHACFQEALRLEPRNAGVHARIGQALLEVGELEEAESSLARACELEPDSSYFRYLHLGLGISVAKSDAIGRLRAIEARSDELDPTDRAYLHFALARALSDIGDNERSFAQSIEANRWERSRRSYDEGATLSALSAIGEGFSPELLHRCRGGGDSSQSPIFIVGMPRSGSTLVEQMLAANRDVIALGELRSFQEAVHASDKRKHTKFPGWLDQLEVEDVRAIAEAYVAKITAVVGARGKALTGGLRVVDKMPGNFQYLGLIHLALPNARIIHTRRDAVDTCLSCFRNRFTDVPFSYDLGELGRYYRVYERLMARWSEILPKGTILHVDHEELVSDFETGARRIVAFCGLDWDDACLAFQDVKRPVRTVSAVQVRQPLMKGRRPWRPSDEALKPLLDELRA